MSEKEIKNEITETPVSEITIPTQVNSKEETQNNKDSEAIFEEKVEEQIEDKSEVKEEDAYDKDDEKPKSKPKKEEVKEKDLEETHMGQTKKANNHQKSANGEKEIIKSGAKLKFKEAYKKVKENQTTTDDSTQDRANQGDSLDDNSKDPDIKKPKGKADTGSKPTPVDTCLLYTSPSPRDS